MYTESYWSYGDKITRYLLKPFHKASEVDQKKIEFCISIHRNLSYPLPSLVVATSQTYFSNGVIFKKKNKGQESYQNSVVYPKPLMNFIHCISSHIFTRKPYATRIQKKLI